MKYSSFASRINVISRKFYSTITSQPFINSKSWQKAADHHAEALTDLLYPLKGKDWKTRFHAISDHPIYNFMHSYYRYSATELKLYSPGMDYVLDEVTSSNQYLLHPIMNSVNNNDDINNNNSDSGTSGNTFRLNLTPELIKSKRYGLATVARARDILEITTNKSPYFSCYGMHEWAMLYSNRTQDTIDASSRHQSKLKLRISQKVIDETVESKVMTCTHFDAWRFFHPAAQPMNVINPMTRQSQLEHEQPGCIHATMDLFKYAHQLYPFVSSELLRECANVAREARKIDIRASPYDVSKVEGCEIPLCVETIEGKLLYAKEQQRLFNASMPLRKQLLHVYNQYLELFHQANSSNGYSSSNINMGNRSDSTSFSGSPITDNSIAKISEVQTQ